MNKIFIVRNEAKGSADIFLYGIVGDYWYSDSSVNARNLQYQMSLVSDFARINIHLCGPGGDVHEGLLMCNIIKASKKEIHVYNDGVCCSMMAVLLMSCVALERRHAATASLTMFHSASTIVWGNSTELRETADMLDKHDDVLADIIADATGMTIDQVKTKWFDGKDHWLTAKEGGELGLFLVEEYEIQPIPEDATNKSLDKIAAFYSGKTNPITTKLNNEHMIFGDNKFKSLTALAKLAVNDITADHVKAINDEIEKEKIPGVTAVLDSELQAVKDRVEKLDEVEASVVALQSSVSEKDQKILDLQAIVDEQKKKLGLPAEDPKAPTTTKVDDTVIDNETLEPASPQDKEMAEIKRVSNLIS
jgi:ATP-dependent protease ClpP protease subunit